MKFSLQLGKLNFSLGSDRPPASTQPQIRSTPAQVWMGGGNYEVSTLVSPFEQSVWVYTVVSALAQTISAIPFRISRGDRSGETVLTQGPAIDLFNSPHPHLNRFRFWEFIVTWYCLRGEAFIVALDKSGNILPIRNPAQMRALASPRPAGSPSPSHTASPRPSDGRGIKGEGSDHALVAPKSSIHHPSSIHQLLVLPPDQFRHVVEGSELLGWDYRAAPRSSPLPSMTLVPQEVIHDFLPNPYLFWRGLSPLSVAMLAAQSDFASAQFMKGLLQNNGDPGLIVRTDQQLSPEQHEQLLAGLRQRKASPGADHPLILWGAAEVIRPTLSNADLQFMDHRKMNRQEICAAFFRMPQSLIGFTENANRSIAETERLNFIENSIIPLCARLEAAVQPIVNSFGPDLVGWFDTDSIPVMQQARRSRVDTAVKLFGLGYPVNSVNQALDLGLPHLDWGNKGYLPIRLQAVGERIEPPPEAKAPDLAPPPTEQDVHDASVKAVAAADRIITRLPQLSKELHEAKFARLINLVGQLRASEANGAATDGENESGNQNPLEEPTSGG